MLLEKAALKEKKNKSALALSCEALEELLRGCQRNVEHHQEALYKAYYGYVKGVVIRYVNDYQATEELINDSFIKIFSKVSSFGALEQSGDLQLSFKAWIARIASRTSIDFLRKKKIQFTSDEITEQQTPVSLSAAQYAGTEAKDILKLLNELPQTQKAIFNLYEIEGFSHEEIGKILSIPENVSRSYLSRAKSRLKSLYLEKF
ncbi:hypothetical protein GCM10027051_15130 [Niabella terrae]